MISSLPPPPSLSAGPEINVGPVDQMLQARENLTLNCTGVNNMDATQPLTINWMFTALDGDNTQTLYYTIDSPQVIQMEMDDNFTIIGYFTINSVASSDSGEYGCYVFNNPRVRPVSANATVTVFCNYFINNFLPELIYKGMWFGWSHSHVKGNLLNFPNVYWGGGD